MRREDKGSRVERPVQIVEEVKDPLTEICRVGAQEMLAEAIEVEVAEFLERHRGARDEQGRQRVVRNGSMPAREIQTGIGPVRVEMPRVRDRGKAEERIRFTSKVLPPYLRRTRSLEEMIPWLYLKGISTGDFSEALAALLGPDAPGLSATTISRLKESWEVDLCAWQKRSLSKKEYVYVWADGVYFSARLEETNQCILVVIGATADGHKELIAIEDGVRESEQSWKALLLSLKARGLKTAPKLAIGDGALGFWKALVQVYGKTRPQRCWVHKTANVLNKLPKGEQKRAKAMIHEIWMASTKAEAEKAFDLFVKTYEAKHPNATSCLENDRAELLAFYDFPAEHWKHVRTTNPVESTFATVRLRTAKTRGCLSRTTALTMVFRLCQCAQKSWRRLHGWKAIADVLRDVRFVDGVRKKAA